MRFRSAVLPLALLLFLPPAFASDVQKADAVLVIKSEKRLYLMDDGAVFLSLPATFGGQPRGHKRRQGDEKTPEGRYALDYKNPVSKFYKSIHISYPNAEDRKDAKKRGVNPGGDIMIHGQPNEWTWAGPILQLFSWTDGCIALSNKHMDQVWEAVDAGTPIDIHP